MAERKGRLKKVVVLIKRLPGAEDIALPAYQTEHAAAMDIRAGVKEPAHIPPGGIGKIPTGFSVALPVGFEAQIRPRSGLATEHKISIPNTPATIDADYRGEIIIPLINLGSETFVVTRGMRIAQMLIVPVPRTEWHLVKELPPTVRGTRGFGHSGK